MAGRASRLPHALAPFVGGARQRDKNSWYQSGLSTSGYRRRSGIFLWEGYPHLASNRQIVEVIFKTEICGREANDCADSSRKAVTVEKDGRLLDYEDADSGSSTSARLFFVELTSVGYFS